MIVELWVRSVKSAFLFGISMSIYGVFSCVFLLKSGQG